MSERETVAKNRIEFQWGSKLQGTSSEALPSSKVTPLLFGNGSVNSVVGKLPASYQRVLTHKKSYG